MRLCKSAHQVNNPSSGWNSKVTSLFTGEAMEIPLETDVPHNQGMQPAVTKDLLDARLEAIEARMDARVAGMSSKLDTALAEIRADRETNTIRFAAMTDSIKDVKEQVNEVKEQGKSLRDSVWGAAVATITIVAAIVAFGISAFDSGRETSKSIAEATVRMEKLQAQIEAQAKAQQSPSAQQQR